MIDGSVRSVKTCYSRIKTIASTLFSLSHYLVVYLLLLIVYNYCDEVTG